MIRLCALLLVLAPLSARASKIGDDCSSKSCSGVTHLACFDKLCACQAGFFACGDSLCADLANDPAHCGACRIACKSGEACKSGVCGGPIVPGYSSATPPFDMTPTYCPGAESHQSLSLTSGVAFQCSMHALQAQVVSWASPKDYTTWHVAGVVSPATFFEPFGFPPYVPAGDEWTTTSGFTGLEYVAARTASNLNSSANSSASTSPAMFGVAAVLPSPHPNPPPPSLEADEKNYVAKLIWPSNGIDDGMSVAFDPGGASLWAAAGGKNHGAQFVTWLLSFPKCNPDVVGGPGCPRDLHFGPAPANSQAIPGALNLVAPFAGHDYFNAHSTVMVNPCTHHALVSFITFDHAHGAGSKQDNFQNRHGFVEILAVDHAGNVVQKWEHEIGSPGGDTACSNASGPKPFDCQSGNQTICPSTSATNPNCCWSGKGCNLVSRTVSRVQMDVKVENPGDSPTCTLFLGWDDVDGYPKARRRAVLGSLDVTAESKSAAVKILFQANPSLGETLNAVPVASAFAEVFGFFYVQRDLSGATEVVHARVTTNPSKFGSADDVAVSSAINNVWMGDNMSQLTGGLPGGTLLATWPDLNNTAKPCTTIHGAVVSVAQPCGGAQMACCGVEQTCDANLSCTGTSPTGNFCRCGAQGDPCCAGNVCFTGVCDPKGSGKCIGACGHVNQLCCGSACNQGASCVGGHCVCGGINQACCQPGNTCSGALTCSQFFCLTK